jgi:hypothetical protein
MLHRTTNPLFCAAEATPAANNGLGAWRKNCMVKGTVTDARIIQ